MTELTEYLIELGKMLGIDTDTEGCVNPNLALSARIVLAIDELERPLQWKSVADGLPEVEGWYNVMHDVGFTVPETAWWEQSESDQWERTYRAYIPVPIPEYVKEQR